MGDPAVTVVIPTHNRAATVLRCLRSLERVDVPAADFEVLVVLNNCVDDTAATVDSYAKNAPFLVRRVEERTPGVAAARNRGIREARGRILAFIDDDEEPSPRWPGALVDALSRGPSPAVAAGRVEMVMQGGRPAWLSEKIFDLFGAHAGAPGRTRVRYPGVVPGGNFACHREVFTRLGAFNEAFLRTARRNGQCEDGELTMRLMFHHVPIHYVSEAVTYHEMFPERLTPENIEWLARGVGEQRAYLFDGLGHQPRRYLWQGVDLALYTGALVRASTLAALYRGGPDDLRFAWSCKRAYDLGYVAETGRRIRDAIRRLAGR
jgi:glycosyltransferase involved in cell wall biosynthesis